MKIEEISPRLYSVSRFRYVHGEQKTRLDTEKTQYVYRFLCFTKGRLDVYIEKNRYTCFAGDVLYLVPGDEYRFVPLDCDFSLYNVFFDFFDVTVEGREDKDATCIFSPFYNPSLRSPQVDFEDADMLNSSTLFKDVECQRIFESAITAHRTDPLYDFHSKTAVISAVSQILQNERQRDKKASGVDNILTYINLNPDKDLSADALSSLFGYHKNHINHLVKSATSLTLSEYVRKRKIDYAKTLLSESALAPIAVSAELGYYDYSHFYKAFKDETGLSPKEYVKRK